MTQLTNIQGILQLTSPMHVASTDDPSQTVQQSIIAEGVRRMVPYFPANDLRGRLRRKAAAIVMDALASTGQKVSISLYAGLCTGAIDANPDSGSLSIEEAHRASKNLYMGLFGGACRMLRSRFSTQDILPVIRSTVAAGLVPKNFGGAERSEESMPVRVSVETDSDGKQTSVTKDLENGFEIIGKRVLVRVDDVMRVMRPEEMMAYVEDCSQATQAYQAAVIEGRADVKASKAAAAEAKKNGETEPKKAKKRDLANMMEVNGILPGVKMFTRLDMQDTMTDAQIGLLISALRDLLNEQGFGGWGRVGFGRFNAKDFQIQVLGEKFALYEHDSAGQLQCTAAVGKYVDAMRCELAKLQVSDLQEFFTKSGA